MLVLFKTLIVYPILRPAIRAKFDSVPGGSGRFTLGRGYEVVGASLENGVYKWLIADNFGEFQWVEHHNFSTRPSNEYGQYTDLTPPSNLPKPWEVQEPSPTAMAEDLTVPAPFIVTAEGKAQKSPKKVQHVPNAE